MVTEVTDVVVLTEVEVVLQVTAMVAHTPLHQEHVGATDTLAMATREVDTVVDTVEHTQHALVENHITVGMVVHTAENRTNIADMTTTEQALMTDTQAMTTETDTTAIGEETVVTGTTRTMADQDRLAVIMAERAQSLEMTVKAVKS